MAVGYILDSITILASALCILAGRVGLALDLKPFSATLSYVTKGKSFSLSAFPLPDLSHSFIYSLSENPS